MTKFEIGRKLMEGKPFTVRTRGERQDVLIGKQFIGRNVITRKNKLGWFDVTFVK